MWVFTKQGFFSVVEDRENSERVIVRARTKDDIERLAKKLDVRWKKSDTLADYPFRLGCSKLRWGRYLADSALDIDYDNFKHGISKLFGVERMNQLHEVWAVMQRDPFDDYDFRHPVTPERYSNQMKDLFKEYGIEIK